VERADLTLSQSPLQPDATRLDVLGEIERQVLWLSTAIIHHANRVRPNPGGLKVGGHQASSASLVSIMTSLWFGPARRGPGLGQAARLARAARQERLARGAG
jgi:pyruvate dehydrogenase E1 component